MTTNNQVNQQTPLQDIPVTYLWFGKTVPEDYLISLSDLNYPVVFMKNPMLQRNFTRQLFNIQKSDYYRLQHLYQYGGIYSDFDNTIDYPCLMKLLEPYRTQDKLVFMADSTGDRSRQKNNQLPNHLIYAPYPKMPLLRQMLNKIDQNKHPIWQFGRSKFLGQFKDPIELNMSKCVRHGLDWSWYQQSNKALNRNAKGKQYFKKKLITKKQVIEQNERLEKEIQEQKVKVINLNNEVLQSNSQKDKLMKEVLSNFKGQLGQTINSGDNLNVNTVIQGGKQKQISNKLSIEQVNKLSVQTQLQNSLWQSKRTQLQNKIITLEVQNSNLQVERNIRVSIMGGILFLIVIVLMSMVFMLRRKKSSPYSNLESSRTSVNDQAKQSPK